LILDRYPDSFKYFDKETIQHVDGSVLTANDLAALSPAVNEMIVAVGVGCSEDGRTAIIGSARSAAVLLLDSDSQLQCFSM
jgi:hypothetical protein